jgi:hypothetical protein
MINHELETGVTESARRINDQELREFGDNAPFVCLFSGGKDSGLAISIAQDFARPMALIYYIGDHSRMSLSENYPTRGYCKKQQQRFVKELIERQIEVLQERVKTLERQAAKDSHNSSLPPSSDRFVRVPKSLRQKSGKKPGGQHGHRGHHLKQVEIPDTVQVQGVEQCEHCQRDLRECLAHLPERRQVIDLPVKRLWVTEYQVEEKACPSCFHLT